jgi:hypothetical protein
MNSMQKVYSKIQTNLKYKGPEIYNRILTAQENDTKIIVDPLVSDIYSIGYILLELKQR